MAGSFAPIIYPSAPPMAPGSKQQGGGTVTGVPVHAVTACPVPCAGCPASRGASADSECTCHSPACAAGRAKEPLSLRLCGAQAQWWLFGLGFLCPILWLVACVAPAVACARGGAPATRARMAASRSTVVAWSLSLTAALTAVILGSIAAALLVIASGGGNGYGGIGHEYYVGSASGVPEHVTISLP